MNTRVKREIIALAEATPNLEICGFIYQTPENVFAYPCINISVEPTCSFEIDSQEYIDLSSRGIICGIYHSHPKGDAILSDKGPGNDLDIANEIGLPIFLYAVETKRWTSYIPPSYRINTTGRYWAWGEADCFETIRVHYRQEKGIYITDYDRDETFEHATESAITQYIEKEGFVFLDEKSTPQLDDVLLFKTMGSSYPHHLAVIVGPNQMLHHPREKLSRIDTIDQNWLKKLVGVLRYKGKA